MSELTTFCRQVRARSAEHRLAIAKLQPAELHGQNIAILRQELDSMVRVIYLLSITDRERRYELIKSAVDGEQWSQAGSKKRITDREMVDLANSLQGWTQSVYRFGCAFIHLSEFHDYKHRDPMDLIADEERRAILDHMRYYHGGPIAERPSFSELIPYLPRVFEKIAANLEHYVRDLEKDGNLS
jgi:hypothetical protein